MALSFFIGFVRKAGYGAEYIGAGGNVLLPFVENEDMRSIHKLRTRGVDRIFADQHVRGLFGFDRIGWENSIRFRRIENVSLAVQRS